MLFWIERTLLSCMRWSPPGRLRVPARAPVLLLFGCCALFLVAGARETIADSGPLRVGYNLSLVMPEDAGPDAATEILISREVRRGISNYFYNVENHIVAYPRECRSRGKLYVSVHIDSAVDEEPDTVRIRAEMTFAFGEGDETTEYGSSVDQRLDVANLIEANDSGGYRFTRNRARSIRQFGFEVAKAMLTANQNLVSAAYGERCSSHMLAAGWLREESGSET
jgi:hypothetical protein